MRSLNKLSKKRLSFFTDPYPDELLYSAFARYHFYSGNIDCKDTLTELFGKNSAVLSFEMGSHIAFLCNALGGSYTPDYLIQNHTLFPFYAPFLPESRKREIIKDIMSSDGRGIYTKIGIVAGSICKKDCIFFCPACVRKEMESLGEAYVHREHQLQGIFMCPHHGKFLKEYHANKWEKSRVEYIRLDGSLLDLSDILLYQGKHTDKLLEIAKAAYYLLSHSLGIISKSDVLLRYKNLLYKNDLATDKLRIKQDELHDRVVGYYGTELLSILESSIDKNNEYNWLRAATRNVARTVHPLRHILLILFLTGDISEFFQGVHESHSPFGKGPWPCLNKAADHFKQDVVTDLAITADFKTRAPVGTFECQCGYIYSRKGPDKDRKDLYRKGRVKAFGFVWENKLKTLLSQQCHSYRKMAQQLGADIKTIQKFEKLFAESSPVVEKQKSNINLKAEYREKLLLIMKEYPELSRTSIRSRCQKEYTYLHRHDRKWLFEELPKKKQSKGSNGYIDWDERDHEILMQLQKAHID
ncbi:MAG: TnsD family transposase [Parabacteroides sp.]|nr:TnsD family transposase [Parabacteroides sp.]